jgi:thymidylate synthase
MKPGVKKLSPVVVSISAFDDNYLPLENAAIRAALDQELQNEQNCRTVANTIFPNSLWLPHAPDNANELYDRYDKIWPRVKKCRANINGVYFRRLTAYSPKVNAGDQSSINQLDHIISTYRGGNHRHSALQASVFDPTRDHSNSGRRGFPCLQQVAFGATDGELDVTGFYANQYHIAKSYGNYLGLCWLGRFMAQQMGLKLTRVNCISSVLNLGDYTKTALSNLKLNIENILTQSEECET